MIDYYHFIKLPIKCRIPVMSKYCWQKYYLKKREFNYMSYDLHHTLQSNIIAHPLNDIHYNESLSFHIRLFVGRGWLLIVIKSSCKAHSRCLTIKCLLRRQECVRAWSRCHLLIILLDKSSNQNVNCTIKSVLQ